MIYINIS